MKRIVTSRQINWCGSKKLSKGSSFRPGALRYLKSICNWDCISCIWPEFAAIYIRNYGEIMLNFNGFIQNSLAHLIHQHILHEFRLHAISNIMHSYSRHINDFNIHFNLFIFKIILPNLNLNARFWSNYHQCIDCVSVGISKCWQSKFSRHLHPLSNL
jgi:hypothetical protein